MTWGGTVLGSKGASFTWWYLPANVVREEHLHDPDRLDQPMGAINTYGFFLPQVLPKTRLAPSGLGGDARHKEAQRTRPLHAIGACGDRGGTRAPSCPPRPRRRAGQPGAAGRGAGQPCPGPIRYTQRGRTYTRAQGPIPRACVGWPRLCNRLALRHVPGGEDRMSTSLGQDPRRFLSESTR